MSDRARAGFAAAGLVLIGFALGVFADHLWLAFRMHRSEPELTHAEAMVQTLHSLDLTDGQQQNIEAILRRYHEKVQEQLAAVHPLLLSTIDSARHEIEAVLDPGQLETFRAWLREEHERGRPVQIPVMPH
jgi:hypothetical protein